MERGQQEVPEKIRSAIKKKLTQMNAFVDDELSEYIMILIANKRTRTQIEKDLSLFLGRETTEFCDWLDGLLKSFKSVASLDFVTASKIGIIEDDVDVLALDPQECEEDFLSQELGNDEVIATSTVLPVKDEQVLKKKETNHPIDNASKQSETNYPVGHVSHENDGNRTAKQGKVFPTQQLSKTPVCSTVVPMKRPLTRPRIKPEDEYDPLNPYVNVSSVVRVSERKFSVPASIQANKMLLKAMDDATKSVLAGKDINEFYSPTPIKVLTSDRDEKPSYQTKSRDRDNIRINMSPLLCDSELNLLSDSESLSPCPDNYENKHFEMMVSNVCVANELIPEDPILFSNRQSNEPQPVISSDMDTDFRIDSDSISHEGSLTVLENYSNVTDQKPASPHFIVTLEGLEKHLKRKRRIVSSLFLDDEEEDGEDLEYEDDELDEDDMMEIETTPKKQKVLEKCRYWPACTNGSECPYLHPMAPCKLFPKCRYGGSCFYIHPNCKFDALCSKKECPYTHASKRRFPSGEAMPGPMPMAKKNAVSNTVCRFFPNCTSKHCTFLHPTLCWYGRDCQSMTCTYSHLNVPSKSQMKWHA